MTPCRCCSSPVDPVSEVGSLPDARSSPRQDTDTVRHCPGRATAARADPRTIGPWTGGPSSAGSPRSAPRSDSAPSPRPAARRATRTRRPRSSAHPSPKSGVHNLDGLPVADWVTEENASRKATLKWVIPRSIRGTVPAPIEGYLDHVSATVGEEITLYVNTVAPSFRAYIYRIGYYRGYGGRLVEASPVLAGVRQAPANVQPGVNMVECSWTPSWRTTVGPDWPSGSYLIRLEGSRGEQQYVPLTIRDDTSHAAFLVQNSVTTWQAYNPYGGYSLYGGLPDGGLANRSRIVSFDRPYSHDPTALDAHGSGDFLGNEFPFIYLAERRGLDVTYWTDVDLHVRPELLAHHRCLVSLGHDEYWSMVMRDATEASIAVA